MIIAAKSRPPPAALTKELRVRNGWIFPAVFIYLKKGENTMEKALIAEEILRCAEAMVRIAQLIRGTEEEEVVGTSEAEPVMESEKAPEITFTDVRTALAQKAKLGKEATVAVRELIRKYGAEKLSEVKPEMYADLLREAEVIEGG